MNAEIQSCAASKMVKCPRCWHYHAATLNYDGLCNSCVNTILQDFPGHPSVQRIKQNLADCGLTPSDNPALTK